MTQLLSASDAFITGLHLAGYVVTRVVAAFDGRGDAFVDVALPSMDVVENTAWGDALDRPWPSRATAVLGLYVEPRWPFARVGRVPVVDVPTLVGDVAFADFSTSASGWLFITATASITGVGDAMWKWHESLERAKAALIDDLATAAGAAGDLTRCGLLGMYNPASWVFTNSPGRDAIFTTVPQLLYQHISSTGLKPFLISDLGPRGIRPSDTVTFCASVTLPVPGKYVGA